jgi:hypothetical protein
MLPASWPLTSFLSKRERASRGVERGLVPVGSSAVRSGGLWWALVGFSGLWWGRVCRSRDGQLTKQCREIHTEREAVDLNAVES